MVAKDELEEERNEEIDGGRKGARSRRNKERVNKGITKEYDEEEKKKRKEKNEEEKGRGRQKK